MAYIVHLTESCLKFSYKQQTPRNHTGFGVFVVVDTNGLEPLTFRTSSGCSTN